MTDGVSYTGNPVSILTGQSVISAIALLQHVAYPGLTENDPPSHYLYVFGASDGGDAYFGVAQLPGLSTQQSVATALTTLQVRSVASLCNSRVLWDRFLVCDILVQKL